LIGRERPSVAPLTGPVTPGPASCFVEDVASVRPGTMTSRCRL